MFPQDVNYDDVFTFREVVNYGVYALGTTRMLRILHGHENIDHISDLVKRWSCHRFLTVVTILLFGGSPPPHTHTPPLDDLSP